MGKLGVELEIVADYIFSEVKKADRIFANETSLQTLASGSGSTKTAYLCAYARDDRTFGRSGPPMVAYRFEAAAPANARSGISMVIAAFCRWMATPRITAWRARIAPMTASPWLAAGHTAGAGSTSCMLQEARKCTGDGRADGKALAGREDRGRSKPHACALPRANKPPQRSSQISSISGNRPCGGSPANQHWPGQSAIAVSRRAIFERFLIYGRIELDSNIVERAIRPQTITRKNNLFAGSDGGGRT